jgi:hypothetical protein
MPLAQGVEYPRRVNNTLSWLRQNPLLAAVVGIVLIILIAIISGLIAEWMQPDSADYFECVKSHSSFDCRQYLP